MLNGPIRDFWDWWFKDIERPDGFGVFAAYMAPHREMSATKYTGEISCHCASFAYGGGSAQDLSMAKGAGRGCQVAAMPARALQRIGASTRVRDCFSLFIFAICRFPQGALR
jgi:hypothetical protein